MSSSTSQRPTRAIKTPYRLQEVIGGGSYGKVRLLAQQPPFSFSPSLFFFAPTLTSMIAGPQGNPRDDQGDAGDQGSRQEAPQRRLRAAEVSIQQPRHCTR